MNPHDSVDKRLTALAEWLKSNATDGQEPSNVDKNNTTMYQNHVEFFYHPYSSFGGQFTNNRFVKYTSKPQRERTTFTESHLEVLENCFHQSKHPDTSRREKLAMQLGLPVKTIQIWFQNRRAKDRKDEKEKSANNACAKDSQRSSRNESDYNSTCNSGSQDCPQLLTTNLRSNTVSQGTCTTTVVQELDSSIRQHERSHNNTDHTIKENRQPEEEFTIVHIPETHASTTDNHQINSVSMNTTDIAKMICQTDVDETLNMPLESTTENQFARLVENLDINLIVQTYEVLQSSENPDVLIENWLKDFTRDEENGLDKLTLEENLKCFIQFSTES